MAAENSAEVLFVRLDAERKTGELLQLPKDFYEEIERHNGNTDLTDKHVQNVKKTLEMLKTKRMQKILIYLAYGKSLPSQVPVEEENIYNEIKRILNKEIVLQKTTKIRIITKIPEIITTSGQKIGPFEIGEVISSDKAKDIPFILNNKIGEIIEQ